MVVAVTGLPVLQARQQLRHALRALRVAGQVVDVWAIEGTEHIEFAGNVVDGSGTSLFSPKHGLVVRADSTIKGSSAQGAQERSQSMEIQNLDPE